MFIKEEALVVLVVGGGITALKKLKSVLYHTPGISIRLVAGSIHEDIRKLAAHNFSIELHEREYESDDLNGCELVIIAVNNRMVGQRIYREARVNGKLVNSANDPAMSDCYLGSEPGMEKIATDFANDNSPAIVSLLSENTKKYSIQNEAGRKTVENRWKRIASYFLFAFFFMFVGHLVLSYIPFFNTWQSLVQTVGNIAPDFYWMMLAGFLAQLVDGALGMGYGVTSTTILLSIGVNLPAISGSVHTAEMFSSGVSGYSHYKFGNVNKKLFKTLLIPGVLGAIVGAYLLATLGNQYADYIRPVLAAYTLFLGVKIIRNVFKNSNQTGKVKRVGWLAGAGGFLDSFGGGGWGPLVTSTLISKGRSPKYVIGSVSVTEFFVTLASAVTFFIMLGVSHWPVIFGLIIGGTIAAPLSAKLAGRLPLKAMFIGVGGLVIIWSIRILLKTFI